jgi:hypothetical protein
MKGCIWCENQTSSSGEHVANQLTSLQDIHDFTKTIYLFPCIGTWRARGVLQPFLWVSNALYVNYFDECFLSPFIYCVASNMSPLCWSSWGRGCGNIVRSLNNTTSIILFILLQHAVYRGFGGGSHSWVVSRCVQCYEFELNSSLRSNEPAPQIAIDYWRLRPDAKLLDVLYAVRSDESTHRFVNHSLANLNHSTDVNPFALREPDMHIKGKKIAYVYCPPYRLELAHSFSASRGQKQNNM